MIITVTGASGFVGQNLTKYLQNNKLIVQTLSLRGNWTLDSTCDAIIHLAGKAHDTKNTSSNQEYFKVNRDLTIKLFDEFLNSNVKDFFYFSSVKAVADQVQDILIEDCLPCPETPYGKSKLEAEQYLLNQKLPLGKRLFIIRPCMIHGPGNKGNLNLLYKAVEKGFPWPLASFTNQRSFLSIDNLNFLILQILKNDKVPSGIYNFSDDESLSTNELIELIAESVGKRAILWRMNRNFLIRLAKIGDFLKLPLNSERLKKLTESYIVSNKKIKQVLKIENLPISTSGGLRATLLSFRK